MNTTKNGVEELDALCASYQSVKSEISKIIIGQDDVVKAVLMAIFSNGHCLLVGVPGLAKTLLIQTLAQALDLSFNRVQFTPDLMPSDILGAEVFGDDRNFKFIKGPVFANIVLADEINRTPPKTQSALLEAMQERAVTVAGVSHRLPAPFFVLATQNPIEQEGTYPLPEAQLDRFMFNIVLEYPTLEQEIAVVKSTTGTHPVSVQKIMGAQEILKFQQLIRGLPITDHVLEYAVRLATKTRPNTPLATLEVNKFLNWGAGPRASQQLVLGAKCHAAIQGKYAPDVEDVQAVAINVLRHRIVRNYKAEAEGMTVEKIITNLF